MYCWGAMGLFALINLTYLLVLLRSEPKRNRLDELPFISVLVAARDEEIFLPDCLSALLDLDYPQEKIEILVGDDDSSDGTAAVIAGVQARNQRVRNIPIAPASGSLKGKQNVLAQLAEAANGALLLVTDADIRVNPAWASAMAEAFSDPKVGLVCGTTLSKTGVEGLDWAMGIALQTAHARLGIPITAFGNNMGVRAAAYEQAGGYANMEFSIVEDYRLFQVLCERGNWKFKQLLAPRAFAETEPLSGVRAWIQQRKRWFTGAMGLAWYNTALIFFNALIFPTLALAFAFLPLQIALGFLILKFGFDFALLGVALSTLGQLPRLVWFPVYELYYLAATVATPLLLVLPIQIVWKGRTYTKG